MGFRRLALNRRPTWGSHRHPGAPSYDRPQVKVCASCTSVSAGFIEPIGRMYSIDLVAEQGKALDWGICGVGVMPFDLGKMKEAMQSQWIVFTRCAGKLPTEAGSGVSRTRLSRTYLGTRRMIRSGHREDGRSVDPDRLTLPSPRAATNFHPAAGEFCTIIRSRTQKPLGSWHSGAVLCHSVRPAAEALTARAALPCRAVHGRVPRQTSWATATRWRKKVFTACAGSGTGAG